MKKTDDLRHAATRGKAALATLRDGLGPASGDVAKALTIIDGLVIESDSGRDPLLLPDHWPERIRWPMQAHWDCWEWAIKTLAKASGTTAHCSQKYGYLRVDVGQTRNSGVTTALAELSTLIERASDTED